MPATGSKVEAHNLYGQVLGEMGVLGVVTFLPIVALLFVNARAIKAAYKKFPNWRRDHCYYLADSVLSALLLLLLLGWAGHSLFRYTWLWYGAFLIIARDFVDQRILKEQRETALQSCTR
jgi:hypothetical protein